MSGLSRIFTADYGDDLEEGSSTPYTSLPDYQPPPAKTSNHFFESISKDSSLPPLSDFSPPKNPSSTGTNPRKITGTFEIGEERTSVTVVEGSEPSNNEEDSSKKKSLITINDLNEKFVSSNFYYVLLAIFLYIGLGIAAYHSMMGWSRFESLYFIIITVSTVGYGDYVPNTPPERVFTAFYILVGVTVFGSLFGTITTFVQDHQDRMAKLRSMRAMIRMKEEMEKVSQADSAQHAAILAAAVDNPLAPRQSSLSQAHRNSTDGEAVQSSRKSDESQSKSGFGNFSRRLSLLVSRRDQRKEKTVEELRDASIAAYEEDRHQLRRAAVIDFLMIFGLLIFGMVCMSLIEGWSSSNSFYWATVTIMTVGYGDFAPNTVSGKVFTIFYVIFGCSFMAKAVTDFVKFPLLSRLLHNEIKVVNQFSGDLSPEMLTALFENELYQLVPDLKRNADEMNKCEFVLLMLQVMGKVEEKDIFLAARLFDNFDKLKKGFLSKEEMNRKMDEARSRERQREQEERERQAQQEATVIGRLREKIFHQSSDSRSNSPAPPKKKTLDAARRILDKSRRSKSAYAGFSTSSAPAANPSAPQKEPGP